MQLASTTSPYSIRRPITKQKSGFYQLVRGGSWKQGSRGEAKRRRRCERDAKGIQGQGMGPLPIRLGFWVASCTLELSRGIRGGVQAENDFSITVSVFCTVFGRTVRSVWVFE